MKKKITCLTIALALMLNVGTVTYAGNGGGPMIPAPISAPLPPICTIIAE